MVRIQSFDELIPKLLTEYQITKSSKSGKDWNEEASFYAGRGKSLRGRGRWQQQGSNKACGTWQNNKFTMKRNKKVRTTISIIIEGEGECLENVKSIPS